MSDTVTLEYVGKLDNGQVFDTTEGKAPLKFTMGSQQILPAFETAVLGMAVGEEKDITLNAMEGYGLRTKDLLQEVPRASVEADQPLEIGATLLATTPEGQEIPVNIINLTNDTVTIDMNHPLAGENLHFHIKLISIE